MKLANLSQRSLLRELYTKNGMKYKDLLFFYTLPKKESDAISEGLALHVIKELEEGVTRKKFEGRR